MSDREKVINDQQMQIEELEERLAIVLEWQPEVGMMDRGKTIEKKILPEYFRAVKDRVKTFELRKDDSDYQVGDILKLREWDGEKYTGNVQFRQITYILRDCPEYGLQPGFCILAIQGTMWEAELLKEQEAVCVKEDRINKCVCGNIVNRYYHPKFCGCCGKELIWY